MSDKMTTGALDRLGLASFPKLDTSMRARLDAGRAARFAKLGAHVPAPTVREGSLPIKLTAARPAIEGIAYLQFANAAQVGPYNPMQLDSIAAFEAPYLHGGQSIVTPALSIFYPQGISKSVLELTVQMNDPAGPGGLEIGIKQGQTGNSTQTYSVPNGTPTTLALFMQDVAWITFDTHGGTHKTGSWIFFEADITPA